MNQTFTQGFSAYKIPQSRASTNQTGLPMNYSASRLLRRIYSRETVANSALMPKNLRLKSTTGKIYFRRNPRLSENTSTITKNLNLNFRKIITYKSATTWNSTLKSFEYEENQGSVKKLDAWEANFVRKRPMSLKLKHKL